MVKTFLVVLMVCILAACAADSDVAPSITPAELSAISAAGASPIIVDVRSAEEYAAGHIPGAVNIPYDQVADRLSELQGPHGVALYCMVGPRARKGESALMDAGFDNILHIEGGLAAWQAAGLSVATVP